MLEKFKDKYNDIVIITAGPSLKKVDMKRLEKFCNGKLVVCVKQTIKYVSFSPDIHLLNDCNLERYNYVNKNVLRIMVKSPSFFSFTPKYMFDVLFKIDKKTCHPKKSLAITRDFKKWEDLKNRNCSWGPGIMHELGIFLPKYLNCKNVYFVGWDIGSPTSNVINRFYETNYIRNFFKEHVIKFNLKFYNNVYVKLENCIRFLLFLFKLPIMLNVPGITDNESIMISASTKDLHDYFILNGIKCYVISDSSMLSSDYQRFTI